MVATLLLLSWCFIVIFIVDIGMSKDKRKSEGGNKLGYQGQG